MKNLTQVCSMLFLATMLIPWRLYAETTKAGARYGTVDVHDPLTQIPVSVCPLFDTPVRDTQICAAPDGFYYLTGTTMHDGGNFGNWNMGIHVWKSKDLKHWEPLGLVWNLDEAEGWQRFFYVYPKEGQAYLVEPREMTSEMRATLPCRRGAWANEIHWAPNLKTFVIVGSINHHIGTMTEGKKSAGHGREGGTFLLKSISGRAEGPYKDIQPERPLTERIDANFFTDDDGAQYLVFQEGRMARFKDDLSGLAETPWRPQETLFSKETYAEGAYLFKAHGKYHLVKTFWSDSHGSYMDKHDTYSYDPLTACAESIRGPYGTRYNPITGGGHGNFFQDHQGLWWACVFNNPRNKCNKGGWAAMPAIVAMQWIDGQLKVDKARTDAFYAELKRSLTPQEGTP
jgi:beta-xylosidase